ncbi:hypothetical protein QAD02_006773 [Eretmocerus hayati]|uniref:Uncharacterized protein n=1 Tax=Eretmocerus hayati TaxID=131215 RepID=A0ACC2N308_9HYME|nr:hypothetical protein QAD02_006773 [Eretmocerus hayati]
MGRRSYRTSKQIAFASNLVAVFYRCSDPRSPNKVMFYLNEAPVLLDGCRVGLCDWDYLKDRFGQFANECNLNFCTDPNSAPISTVAPLLIVLASIATYIMSSLRS